MDRQRHSHSNKTEFLPFEGDFESQHSLFLGKGNGLDIEKILKDHLKEQSQASMREHYKHLVLEHLKEPLGLRESGKVLRRKLKNPLNRIRGVRLQDHYKEYLAAWNRQQTVFCHHLPFDDPDSTGVIIYHVIFCPQMERLLTGGSDGLVKIFSWPSGRHIKTLRGHTADITILTVSQSLKFIASADDSGVVRIWDFPSGKPIAVLKESKGKDITSLAFHQESYSNGESVNFLLICASGHGLFIYNENDFEQNNGLVNHLQKFTDLQDTIGQTNPHANVLFAEINPEGRLSAYSSCGKILLWRTFKAMFPLEGAYQLIPEQQFAGVVPGGKNSVEMNWSPNGVILSNSNEKEAIIFERNQGDSRTSISWQKIGSISNSLSIANRRRATKTSVAAINNEYFIISFNLRANSATEDTLMLSSIFIFSLKLKCLLHSVVSGETSVAMDTMINGLSLHPTMTNVCVTVDLIGRVIFWDLSTGTAIRLFLETGAHAGFPLLPAQVWDCNFSKCGNYLAVSTNFGSFSIYGYGDSTESSHIPLQQFCTSDFLPTTTDAQTGLVLNVEGLPWFENDTSQNCNLGMQPHPEFPSSSSTKKALEWVAEESSRLTQERRRVGEHESKHRGEERFILAKERELEKSRIEKLAKKIKDSVNEAKPQASSSPNRRTSNANRANNPLASQEDLLEALESEDEDQQVRSRRRRGSDDDSFIFDDDNQSVPSSDHSAVDNSESNSYDEDDSQEGGHIRRRTRAGRRRLRRSGNNQPEEPRRRGRPPRVLFLILS